VSIIKACPLNVYAEIYMGYGGIYSLTCPWAIPLLDEDVHPVP